MIRNLSVALTATGLCYGSYSYGKRGGLPTFNELKTDVQDAKKAYNSESGIANRKIAKKAVAIGAVEAVTIPVSIFIGLMEAAALAPRRPAPFLGLMVGGTIFLAGQMVALELAKSIDQGPGKS